MDNNTEEQGVAANTTELTPDRIPSSCPHFHESTLFENATLEVSQFVQVDYEMAVSSALGTIAACCQGLVDVAYPNGHVVPTSLMIMTLAGVSERKTSLDNKFSKPIRELENEKERQDAIEQKKYARKRDIWKQKESVLKKKLAKKYSSGEDTAEIEDELHQLDEQIPKEPPSFRVIYEDSTPIALLTRMYKNLPLAYFLSDEASSLLTGRTFEDVCLFNTLWSGSDVRVDRLTGASFSVKNARLSVSLMMQNEAFNNYLSKSHGKNAYETGFFARFLISCPEPRIPKTLSNHSNEENLKKFHTRATLRLEESLESVNEGRPRKVLKFSETAKESWQTLHAVIASEMEEHRAYSLEKGHAKKIMDNVSRIAALLHTFENEDYADKEISNDYLNYAFSIVKHFSGHYMRVIAQEPKIVKLADKMIDIIHSHANPSHNVHGDADRQEYTFTMSTIKQNTKSELKDTDVFNKVVAFIKDLGHLKEHSSGQSKSYRFSNAIFRGMTPPPICNGDFYYVKNLPKFKDQEPRPIESYISRANRMFQEERKKFQGY